MGSTVQPLRYGKALEACARLVDNDCPDYQIVQGAFLRRYGLDPRDLQGYTWVSKERI